MRILDLKKLEKVSSYSGVTKVVFEQHLLVIRTE